MNEIASGDTLDALLDIIRDPVDGRAALMAILEHSHDEVKRLERQNRLLRRRLQRYEQRQRH